MEQSLETLSAHAIWTRGSEWTRRWFTHFLCPLYSSRLFLPPLFAYELRSAMEKGERRLGPLAGGRNQSDAWVEFLTSVHSVSMGSMSPGRAAKPELREAAAERLARLFALSFTARFDLSQLYSPRVLIPESLVNLEVERLTKKGSTPGPFQQVWDFLEDQVSKRTLLNCIPLSEVLVISKEPGTNLDPFVAKLLDLNDERDPVSEPQIHGTNPRADNPRRIVWPTGEFAKRDLSRLPDELGRLAPNELLLVHEMLARNPAASPTFESSRQLALDLGGRKKGRARQAADRHLGFRTWFLLRVVEGSLLQRLSHSTRSAVMEPIARLQIDIIDDPDQHRLSDPPKPPIISWYRALAVELAHQFALLATPFRWQADCALGYHNGDSFTGAVLDKTRSSELALSRRCAFEVLAESCPAAFSAAWTRGETFLGGNHTYPPEMDLWLRISLGPKRFAESKLPVPLKVRAQHKRAMRIEMLRTGTWGMALADECDQVGALDIINFDQEEMNPVGVASIILKAVLWQSPQEESVL